MKFRLGALLSVIVWVFCSSLIRRLEAVTDAASRIIEFTLTGCTTPSLCYHRSYISLPLRLLLRLFTVMSFPPPLPSIVCATVLVICRLNNRTAQAPEGRSTGKQRAQINKWCKLAKDVGGEKKKGGEKRKKRKKKKKSVKETGLEQGLVAP